MTVSMLATTTMILGVAAVPLIAVLVDLLPIVMTSTGHRPDVTTASVEDDFTILVPIYGDVRYLENADFLRQYGNRVVLCTTSGEAHDFYSQLYAIADVNGLRVFVADYAPRSERSASDRRSHPRPRCP